MTELFTSVMVTFLISWNGEIQKISERSYHSVQECEAHVHQKEFTDYATEKGMYVHVCEWR